MTHRTSAWKLWMADLGKPAPRSLRALCALTGLTLKAGWGITGGHYTPRLSTAVQLARAFGVSVDAVAVACERAQERYRARLAVEQARQEAEQR